MESHVDTLARCRLLALAALERAANVAAPRSGLVASARLAPGLAIAELDELACFAPKARLRILEILDRLPPYQ